MTLVATCGSLSVQVKVERERIMFRNILDALVASNVLRKTIFDR